jgi:hypothetical protein
LKLTISEQWGSQLTFPSLKTRRTSCVPLLKWAFLAA